MMTPSAEKTDPFEKTQLAIPVIDDGKKDE